MAVERPLGPVAQALLSPTGGPTNLLVLLCCLALLWGGGWLAGVSWILPGAMNLGLLLMAYQVLRAVLRIPLTLYHRRPLVLRQSRLFLWPIVLCIAMDMTGLPLRFTVWVHRPWLDRYAHHLYTEIPLIEAPTGGKWIGLFHADTVQVWPNGVTFNLGEDSFSIHYDDARAREGDDHLSGPWFGPPWWAWWQWWWGNGVRDG